MDWHSQAEKVFSLGNTLLNHSNHNGIVNHSNHGIHSSHGNRQR